MPKVSVIIPNYNHAAYLKQRIDSVFNQTYTDFEVIILDDCSTDNSIEIIEQYRNNNKVSHIIYNEINSGNTFKQWDKGIQLAKGEYIWIAESDDWCENNFLETIAGSLEKDKKTVFGYCQSFCVDDDKQVIFQSRHTKIEDYYTGEEYLENYLTFGNAVFNASMAVFKKDFYFKISGFYKSFCFVGDWIFWAELSRLGTVYINAKPLNYFRKHNKDVSSKMYASGLNFIEELKALDYFHKHLQLDGRLFFRAKVKLYGRFALGKNNMDHSTKKQTKQLFFSDFSFLQKQCFFLVSFLYRLKNGLTKRLNTSFNIIGF